MPHPPAPKNDKTNILAWQDTNYRYENYWDNFVIVVYVSFWSQPHLVNEALLLIFPNLEKFYLVRFKMRKVKSRKKFCSTVQDMQPIHVQLYTCNFSGVSLLCSLISFRIMFLAPLQITQIYQWLFQWSYDFHVFFPINLLLSSNTFKTYPCQTNPQLPKNMLPKLFTQIRKDVSNQQSFTMQVKQPLESTLFEVT